MEVIEKEKIKRAQELANSIKTTKEAIRQAIADKDVDIPADTAFADYPAKIEGIYPDALFLRESNLGQLPSVTLPEGPQSKTFTDVLLENDRVIGLGVNGDVYVGTDIAGWQLMSEMQSKYWMFLAYGNGVYVAVQTYFGTTNAYFYSTDLKNWQTGTLPDSVVWEGLTFTGSQFVLCGAIHSNGHMVICTSENGVDWVTVSSNFPSGARSFNGMFYINGIYFFEVQGITYTDLYYSLDLQSFTKVEYSGISHLTAEDCLYQAGAYYIANGDTLIYSNSLSSWTTAKTIDKKNVAVSHIVYANDKFYGYHDEDGVVTESVDGKTNWKALGTAPVGGNQFFFWQNKFIITIGSGYTGETRIYYSYDGVEWSGAAGNSIFDADFVDKRAETEAWLETVPEAVVNALYTETAPLNAAYREGVNAYIGE